LYVKLVVYKDSAEMHGKQNINVIFGANALTL